MSYEFVELQQGERVSRVIAPLRRRVLRSGAGQALVRRRLRRALAAADPDPAIRASDPRKRHVFVALGADYGNLGDLAITKAQREYLERAFPDAVVEAIPISRSMPAIARLRDVIGSSDVITLIGGGNTGDRYDDIQFLRELWVESFPGNKIISFPQTVEFSRSITGRRAARRATRVYSSHPRLAILVRDSRSAAHAETIFSRSTVISAPDVVLTQLPPVRSIVPRSGVLLALRSDLEKSLTAKQELLLSSVCESFDSTRRRDTHIGDVRIGTAEADTELGDIWSEFAAAKLIVTDRLHGVIFAMITGTPCIALDSKTGKVAQFVDDWLRESPLVQVLRADEINSDALQLRAQSITRLAVHEQHLANLCRQFDHAFRKAAD
ncbi:hypothetical protein G7072_00200 [Nocardioides sp. HDW12B]|uniref:polysaccharide pyruvyl transferase family protein n=1 Tax=Nocardioides sp. HDW12B TaxID=2714939 RepID=UPI00140BD8D2|nr:polysaccharide pyruvyl transferase family protein [Nocardioides sp. HDW12B]QIK64964.1 hypothetical protein G7072_00200 [Nocardioides sp. HDW12B]